MPVAILLACGLVLAGQEPLQRPIKEAIERAIERPPEPRLDLDAEFAKYFAQERKYYGWFADRQVKQPFDRLVDNAIRTVSKGNDAVQFLNPGNQAVVDALAKQNAAVPLRERLSMTLESSNLKVRQTYGSGSANVKMDPLKEYIEGAMEKVVSRAGHLNITPEQLKKLQEAARKLDSR